MAWNGFSSAMQYIIDWLCPGFRPHDANSDEFARRTITRVDFACPADGSVNHSIWDLSDMEENTCPVTWCVPLMTLTDGNMNWSQNFAPEDNQIKNQTVSALPLEKEADGGLLPGTKNNTNDVKENKSRKQRDHSWFLWDIMRVKMSCLNCCPSLSQ